jgi:hypothetical protein
VTLQKLLFEPTLVRSPLRVIRWWESRRLMYNALVGAVGLVTLAYVYAVELLVLGHIAGPPWQAVVAYGLVANVFYTLGWVVENIVERWLKRPLYGIGPALFRHGLVFSLGLTVLPAFLVTLAAIADTIFGR